MERFESIGRNMMISDKYFKMYLRDSLRPYGINAAEGIVLLMMCRREMMTGKNSENTDPLMHGNTQDELIREIHYDKGVMTRTMSELEEKGFVERRTNPSDSRSFLFSLTSKWDEFMPVMMEILICWNRRLLSGISEEELAVVQKALAVMAENSSVYYSESLSHRQNKETGRKRK